MNALEFYKEHKEYCVPNPESGMVEIELQHLIEIMEQYHQSKVNNGVLDDVISSYNMCDDCHGEIDEEGTCFCNRD